MSVFLKSSNKSSKDVIYGCLDSGFNGTVRDKLLV